MKKYIPPIVIIVSFFGAPFITWPLWNFYEEPRAL